MSKFRIAPADLEKWIYQNGGEIADCMEGCLLDNLVVECRRGTAFIFENYLNCWSSDYQIIYCKSDINTNSLWDQFYSLEG